MELSLYHIPVAWSWLLSTLAEQCRCGVMTSV